MASAQRAASTPHALTSMGLTVDLLVAFRAQLLHTNLSTVISSARHMHTPCWLISEHSLCIMIRAQWLTVLGTCTHLVVGQVGKQYAE
jgi:hypothetical protein